MYYYYLCALNLVSVIVCVLLPHYIYTQFGSVEFCNIYWDIIRLQTDVCVFHIIMISFFYTHTHTQNSFLTMMNWIRLCLETSIFFHNLHAVHDHPQRSCTPLHVARPFDRLAWQLGRTKRRPSGEDSQLHLTRSQTSSDTRKNGYVWANLILHWWALIHEVVYQPTCTCVYTLFVLYGLVRWVSW